MRISLKPFWRREAAGAGWPVPIRPLPEPAPAWHAPAPGLEADHAAAHYGHALKALASRPGEPLALALRVPFCAAHCMFCDRDIHVAQPGDVIGGYVDTLVEEARLLAASLGGDHDLLQLHLGGGTATELSESQLAGLVSALQALWRLPAEAEMSVECDPRRTSRRHLEVLRGLGFRHVVFGVADLDTAVQKAIGRRHSQALIDDACATARAAGFERIRLDLLIGLPQQTEAGWRMTLERLIGMAPDRIALSCYQHRPGHAPSQRGIDGATLPDAALCGTLWSTSSRVLRDAGYGWIGANHFVLEDDELALAQPRGRLRHNLIGYTATPPAPVIGLGAGALGEIDGSLFWNHAALPDWYAALHAQQLPVQRARLARTHEPRRRLAMDQMLFGLELPAATVRGGLEEAYGRLARHAAQGLVRVLDDRIVVTEAGRPVLPMLCAELGLADGQPAPAMPQWLS